MKIDCKVLAKVCVALLVLYPISSLLVWTYIYPDRYGTMAALFAANAGVSLFVGFVFRLPEYYRCTSRKLRILVVAIGVVSGLVSALYWMADEVDHIWLRLIIISPVLVILLVLMWFVDKANKEETKNEGE